MKRVLILHGWGGSDFPHWQSYLASEIAKEYGCVHFLKFNDFDFPNKDRWKSQLIKEIDTVYPDIVICHSIANILWFHLCNDVELKKDIEHLFLVAPPSLSCDIKELESFFPCKIPTNLYAKNALLITSTNDPYMTPQEALKMQKELDIPIKILEKAGHINAASGYGEWPWMVQTIKKCSG